MNVIKRFFLWIWRFIKSIWEILKMASGWRGILSMIISFLIFAGWAYIMLGLGFIYGNAWMIGVSSAVIVFWAGPFTPLFPIVIVFGLFLQRFIFMDKSISVSKIKEKFKEVFNKDKKKTED